MINLDFSTFFASRVFFNLLALTVGTFLIASQTNCGEKEVDVYRPSDLASLSSGKVKCGSSRTIWTGGDKCNITVEFTNPSGCTVSFNDGLKMAGNKATGKVGFVKLTCTGTVEKECTYNIASVDCLDGKHGEPQSSTNLNPEKSQDCGSTVQKLWPNSGEPPKDCFVTVAFQGTKDCPAIIDSSETGAAPYTEEGRTSEDPMLQTLSKFDKKLFVQCGGSGSAKCNFQVVQVECPKK